MRDGQEVVMLSRKVRIDSVNLLTYRWPELEIEVACGKGTYIRSLARDIGVELGVGGYMSALVRSAVGPFDLARSIDSAGLTEQSVLQKIIPLDEADRLIASWKPDPIPEDQVSLDFQGVDPNRSKRA